MAADCVPNFASIKAMTVRLGGCIVSLKMLPLRSSRRSDDLISRGNKVTIAKWRPSWICHLRCLDFPKTSGKRRN